MNYLFVVAHPDDEVLGDNGLPEVSWVKPFVYAPESQEYFALGGKIGEAWELGKKAKI